VKDNEPIFVSGHPGSTGRLRTVAQLEFLQDVDYPSRLETYNGASRWLQSFSAQSEKRSHRQGTGVQLSELVQWRLQATWGTQRPSGHGQQQADEANWKPPSRRTQEQRASSPWEEIAGAVKRQSKPICRSPTWRECAVLTRNSPISLAGSFGATKRRPNPVISACVNTANRLWPHWSRSCSPLPPLYKSLETVTLADSLAQMRERLRGRQPCGAESPERQDSEEAAKELIENSRLDDVAARKQLYQGGTAVVEASADPMIVLMRAIDPVHVPCASNTTTRSMRWERRDGATIARALFAKSGYNQPPMPRSLALELWRSEGL